MIETGLGAGLALGIVFALVRGALGRRNRTADHTEHANRNHEHRKGDDLSIAPETQSSSEPAPVESPSADIIENLESAVHPSAPGADDINDVDASPPKAEDEAVEIAPTKILHVVESEDTEVPRTKIASKGSKLAR